MFGLHAPDGFLELPTAIAMAVASTAIVALCLKQSRAELSDRQAPLAGLAAAFIFAAQTINFPVGVGTSGHLIGATLAAVLLGPATGTVVLTVVVVVQALLFADGGIIALGYNVANMAIVPALGGWSLFQLFRRFLPANTGGLVASAGLAAWASVVLSSMALSLQWLFGASSPVAFDDLFAAMVAVHAAIGIGEGVITSFILVSVLASRPDLIYAATPGIDASTQGANRAGPAIPANGRSTVSFRSFVLATVLIVIVVAAVVSQVASSAPDGLEAVAAEEGIEIQEQDAPLGPSLFSDYATEGIDNEIVSLAVAAVAGSAIALVVGAGLISGTNRRWRKPVEPQNGSAGPTMETSF